MSGVGTLCANTYYRASLLIVLEAIKKSSYLKSHHIVETLLLQFVL